MSSFPIQSIHSCPSAAHKMSECGSIRLIDVPWARRSVHFTLLMDSMILLLAQNMPVNAVAEIIGEHDTRIWRVLLHYIPECRSKEDHSDAKVVGVDETSGSSLISVGS